MKKQKLNQQLLTNALNFYNEKFDSTFSNTEQTQLLDYLFENIKYDYIFTSEKTPEQLPKTTLKLIYFIGEYKRIYELALNGSKSRDALSALGKGFSKKEKAFKATKQEMNDETLDNFIRYELFFKNLFLLALKKPAYKKVSIAILGLLYTNLPIILPLVKSYIKDLQEVEEDLPHIYQALESVYNEYFCETHLSSNKILNSAIIILYTTLKQYGLTNQLAYKHAKYLVNRFVNSNTNLPVDSFRESYITKKDIYCAGIYGGIPIFQWYIPKKLQSKQYIQNQDIKRFQKIFHIFIYELSYSDLPIDIEVGTDRPEINIDKFFDTLLENELIEKFLQNMHTQFAKKPYALLHHLEEITLIE